MAPTGLLQLNHVLDNFKTGTLQRRDQESTALAVGLSLGVVFFVVFLFMIFYFTANRNVSNTRRKKKKNQKEKERDRETRRGNRRDLSSATGGPRHNRREFLDDRHYRHLVQMPEPWEAPVIQDPPPARRRDHRDPENFQPLHPMDAPRVSSERSSEASSDDGAGEQPRRDWQDFSNNMNMMAWAFARHGGRH